MPPLAGNNHSDCQLGAAKRVDQTFLHYLRLRTTAGEALVLYPFGKAVADLTEAGVGLQIHRSHWVATAHVGRVVRRGQGALCTLSTGLTLPVSRQYRAPLLAVSAASPALPASLRA